MEPIDEIDGKKKRLTMLDNMQRSSNLFQSKIQKSQTKSAEEAKKSELPPQQQPDDSTDFSSEFTNQDTGFDSGSHDVLKSWEDIIDDDDWLNEEEDEEEDESGGGGGAEQQEGGSPDERSSEAPPEDWEPPATPRKGGFLNSAFGSAPPAKTQASPPLAQGSPQPKVEERLGFQWGPVQDKKTPGKPPVVEDGPIAPATRKGGWEALPSAAPAVPPRPRPVPNVMLPARGQLQRVDSAVVAAARLLVVTPEDEPGYEECIRLMSRFGLGAIRMCSKAKVKVHILDEAGFVNFPELVELGLEPDSIPVDGAYLIKSRTCLIDRRCLTEKPRFFHPALYYFAHALDHAQGGEEFSSRKAAAVLACFDASANGYNGCDFVDELAAADPVRYFARSVSIYLGRDDCESPIWTHQDLFDLDRSMYDYLEYLFARFST